MQGEACSICKSIGPFLLEKVYFFQNQLKATLRVASEATKRTNILTYPKGQQCRKPILFGHLETDLGVSSERRAEKKITIG